MIPSATDLMYFLEVANLCNLSRASENLNISQPSLTLAMQRLEHCVGTSIFIRHKKGMTLTKAGKQLLAHARQLLQHWEHLKAQTLASVNEVQGNFTIGCHTSVAICLLPKFLTQLMNEHPQLHITLQHDISRRITEKVINLTIDIGMVVNPVKHPDVVIKKLDVDKFTLWRSSNDNKIQQLESKKAILLCDPELFQTQALLKAMRKLNMHYDRIVPSSSFEVIAELTQKGCGVGILPSKIARKYNLKTPPKAPTYNDEICMLYRGENREVRGIQVITEAIKSVYKS